MNDQNRKLAVIVFTDIVGFTKLTSQDQQKASDLLDTQRKEFSFLVKPLFSGIDRICEEDRACERL